ncbi:MAG: hypothetical protein SGBAC_012001, partial [Bacillariaceae sp.]
MEHESLQPGESTALTETDFVDLCESGLRETVIIVEADGENGKYCYNLEQYIFTVSDHCRVDIDISCTADDGTACMDLSQRTDNCTTSVTYSIDIINFGSQEMSVSYLGMMNDGTDMRKDDALRTVEAGRRASVEHIDVVDLCVSGNYGVSATVAAMAFADGSCV